MKVPIQSVAEHPLPQAKVEIPLDLLELYSSIPQISLCTLSARRQVFAGSEQALMTNDESSSTFVLGVEGSSFLFSFLFFYFDLLPTSEIQ